MFGGQSEGSQAARVWHAPAACSVTCANMWSTVGHSRLCFHVLGMASYSIHGRQSGCERPASLQEMSQYSRGHVGHGQQHHKHEALQPQLRSLPPLPSLAWSGRVQLAPAEAQRTPKPKRTVKSTHPVRQVMRELEKKTSSASCESATKWSPLSSVRYSFRAQRAGYHASLVS